MFKWLFKKKGCAKHMNNKLEVIGIDHGWSMMKTISQVFVTGVKEITTTPALFGDVLEHNAWEKQKLMIDEINGQNPLRTDEEYHKYYEICDKFPFAFTDIEMVFNEKRHAVDWIFRYGNEALAELEGVPLKEMIGSTFSSLFDNMDAKWLRGYERAALYGETMEIEEYSPEIDANLRILCFPTFPGHCGCILHDMDRLQSMKYESWFGMA